MEQENGSVATSGKTPLSKARQALLVAAVAVASAFGGAQVGDNGAMSSEELHGLLGDRINPNSQTEVAMRVHLGNLEAVAYEIPDETWTVAQLDRYLQRMDFLQGRVKDLRTARFDFERAYADSVAQSTP